MILIIFIKNIYIKKKKKLLEVKPIEKYWYKTLTIIKFRW